jgi:hypothetical protein
MADDDNDVQAGGNNPAPDNPVAGGLNGIPAAGSSSQPPAAGLGTMPPPSPTGPGMPNAGPNVGVGGGASPDIPAAATKAGPGVLRGLLGVFLSGLSSGLAAGPGPGGPARAAAGGAASMAQSPLNPANAQAAQAQRQNVQLDTSMKKAQNALLQVQVQRQLALYHQDDPVTQNAKLQAWSKNGDMVMANAAKGNGEILFTTSPDMDSKQAFAALNTEWAARVKKGEYDVVPFLTGDPANPTLGLYKMKTDAWEGGDTWHTANPDDPENPLETPIPDGIKAAGTKAVQAWGLSVDNRAEKARHDAAQAAAKSAQIAQQNAGKLSVVKAQIAGQNWREQLKQSAANGRAATAQANKSGDATYISMVRSYNVALANAAKWADDNKVAAAIGWKDNPFQPSVDAQAQMIQNYEAAHPEVMPLAGSGAAPGGSAPASAANAQNSGNSPAKNQPNSGNSLKGKTFDPKAWSAKHPGGDVNDAIKRARAAGMSVVQ